MIERKDEGEAPTSISIGIETKPEPAEPIAQGGGVATAQLVTDNSTTEAAMHHLSEKQIVSRLLAQAEDFCGGKRRDDIAIIAMRFT